MKTKIGVYIEVFDLQEGEEHLARLLLADIQEYMQKRLAKLRQSKAQIPALMNGEDRHTLATIAQSSRRRKSFFLEQTKAAFERAGTVQGAARLLKITDNAAKLRMMNYASEGWMPRYPCR